MNPQQLAAFKEMTDGLGHSALAWPRRVGSFWDDDYHFDLTRPGVGLYGGMPFVDATPVASLSHSGDSGARRGRAGESVGYGNAWIAERDSKCRNHCGGLCRWSSCARWASKVAMCLLARHRCPLIGRISMDLIGIDVTDLSEVPREVELLGQHQSVDTLADAAGTIGYEILTSMGQRYQRRYKSS